MLATLIIAPGEERGGDTEREDESQVLDAEAEEYAERTEGCGDDGEATEREGERVIGLSKWCEGVIE